MWRVVNHICQYFPLFASISRYFPVNATGMANMLICGHFANLDLENSVDPDQLAYEMILTNSLKYNKV